MNKVVQELSPKPFQPVPRNKSRTYKPASKSASKPASNQEMNLTTT